MTVTSNGNKLMAEVKPGTPVKDDGVSFMVLSAKMVTSIRCRLATPSTRSRARA